uniref:Kdel (Lys-asp-glu-leu) endoplasmic reticulum protein retention receptor 3 n=1 Tax=Tetraselmis sp. GSL018 TaxID=582737 RepID=A0A061RBH4_9CHLO|mmetsp:Transcript_20345/g.48469  ORF Transcript_20345/g.48469 Transcript_20345/m.48469 type:complete len:259 (+) Transcript_20345:644-1420(+)
MGSFNFFRLSGDYIHLGAMLVFLGGLMRNKNARTVSLRAQELYLVVYLLRYLDLLEGSCVTSIHNTVFKISFLSLTAATVVFIRFFCVATWPADVDSRRWYLVCVLAVLYGYIGMASVGLMSVPWNRFVWLEFFWTISQGLEIFAIFPQGWLIYKKQHGQRFVVVWMAMMLAYRFLYCCNWAYRKITEDKFDHISILSGGTQVTAFLCLFVYTITVNRRHIKFNPEDHDIEFAEYNHDRDEYAWLRAGGGSGKNLAIL